MVDHPNQWMTRCRAILDLTATALVICVCLVVLYSLLWPRERTSAASSNRRTNRNPPSSPLPTNPVPLTGAPIKGSIVAPVAIIEYSDFQCPYCAQFARETLPQLELAYIQPGKALIAFRHLPLRSIHPLAHQAAESAECARRQGRFWELHNRLFEDPSRLDRSGILRNAEALGLDISILTACLNGEATDRVRSDAASAQALAISGTPTFLIGYVQPDERVKVTKRLSGARGIEDFKAILDGMLEGRAP